MSAQDKIQREILPIPDSQHVGLTTYDAKDPDTKYPPIEPLRPPKGAPNVLIVLIDDVGFGASSAFGGPCHTPTAERLAANGLKYNRFHTTALCSPTRQALLTGRNHHTVGMGGITEMATSAPGNCSIRPKSCAPLAETLKLNGYATAQFGKCHEVPCWETSPAGPYDAWPTGSGFEYFYGFICAETNQYYPSLYEGTTPVEPQRPPKRAITSPKTWPITPSNGFAGRSRSCPTSPSSCTSRPGRRMPRTTSRPNGRTKYKGKFDQGWDKLREETFARQKELGVIPPEAELTGRHPEIPAWDEMPDEMKPILARQMEIYAGFLEHTDYHVGRLIDALADLEILDDTLIYYIIGDNGASAEGTFQGTFNEMLPINGFGFLETPEFLKENIDKFGSPKPTTTMRWAGRTPWTPPTSGPSRSPRHWGGTRNGTIVHWPKGIQARGEIRSQFCHVIDVAPTVLEAAGLPQPAFVNGIQQKPYEGVSMLYSFDDAGPRNSTDPVLRDHRQPRHLPQGLDGGHQAPNAMDHRRDQDDSLRRRHLGAVRHEHRLDAGPRSLQGDAGRRLDKLHELQRLWLIEAVKYNVVPLDDRLAERFNPDLAGRPQLVRGNRQLLFGGMKGLSPHSVVSILNKSFAITAEVVVPETGRGRGHICLGRHHRRAQPVCQGRKAQVLLQLPRDQALLRRKHPGDPGRQAPGADGVRLRRRRPGQGRRRVALH